MNEHKPIKRHPSLVRFSREHHSGLMLVFKLRRGISNSVRASELTEEVISAYNSELVPHFLDEEENLFSAMSPDDPMRVRAEKDHHQIRNYISQMEKNAGSVELLSEFADLLESHIRFEERELFNRLQEILSEEQLKKIADFSRAANCYKRKENNS